MSKLNYEKIVDGWISYSEMEYVASFMHNRAAGNILEIGSAGGKLFSYLHQLFSQWKFVAVDPWEDEGLFFVYDYSKPYSDIENHRKEMITKSIFQKNCPYAHAYQCYFEDFETEEKFDLISIGANMSNLDWNLIYKKAYNLLKDDGFLIGRNLYHPKQGARILEVIKNYNYSVATLDKSKNNGSFVIKK